MREVIFRRRRQKAESRRQKPEGRKQKAEGRKQKAETRRQHVESRKENAAPSPPRVLSAFCFLPSAFSFSPSAHKLLLGALIFLISQPACVFLHRQRYQHFTTPTPLSQNQILILGFMGGWQRWYKDNRRVRRLALKLRSMNDPEILVETVENKKRNLAIELIVNAFDRNRDGSLDQHERDSARLIIYGQSFGGAAVVKLARQLEKMDIPVALTVQIDSVGRGDRTIPPNVARAANLYQQNGLLIRGEPDIKAENPARTRILGNFRFDYSDNKIDLSGVSFWKKAFRVAHAKMEYDPEVWAKVEELILGAINELR